MIRTHEAGTLREAHVGQSVTLAGWVARRRDHGGVAFIDLRDASGFVQVVIRDEAVAAGLRNEFCLRVVGDVSARPAGNANPNLPTGEVEVVATEVEVLNEAAPLPFQIDDHVEVGEEVRLKYRYLDLRRSGAGGGAAAAQRGQPDRARGAARARLRRDRDADADPLDARGRARLPGAGPAAARAAGTPCRSRRSCSSSCSWSPGWSSYFQIARCYRDEDFRADRQPEFTQLDIEMSFVDQDDVIEIGEAVLPRCGSWSATISSCRSRG